MSRTIFISLAAMILFSATAGAVEYPWLSPANTQVLVIHDPHVDFAARIAAIDRSTQSIDTITYSQGIDSEVGMPLLLSFRRAQARGVKGRYLVERIGSLMDDPTNKTQSLLADSNLKRPGEVISFGGLNNLLAGLNLTDMVHEKILIIDAGTPNEMIWIGGRNNTQHSTTNLDLAVILRRLEPGKPYIGDQIRAAFEDTWQTVQRIELPAKPQKYSVKSLLKEEARSFSSKMLLATHRKLAEFTKLDQVLARPADPTAPLLEYEARPSKMRTLSNDFLSYALTKVFGRGFKSRQAMPNDIVDAASPVVANSKRIYASLMSVFMPTQFKEALKTALKNGAEVHLITNGRETHKTHVPMGLPYDMSLEDILELMDVAHASGGKIQVYVLDEQLLEAASHNESYRWIKYLHRKLLVADDHVFTGSENFNRTSSARNNEIMLHVEDQAFAQQMLQLIRGDLEVFRTLSCQSALTDFRRYGVIKRGLNRLFLPLY